MKFEIKLGAIKIPNVEVVVEGVELKCDISLEEARGFYELQKEVLDDMPELMEKMFKGFVKSQELMKEQEEMLDM